MTESKLELSKEMGDGVCVVTAKGVLDAHTSAQLDQLIDAVIKGGCTRIGCDISAVSYIASAGVGVFIGSVDTCRQAGGNLVLIYPGGWEGESGEGITPGFNVLEVFNLLGLTEIITAVGTVAEAKKALA